MQVRRTVTVDHDHASGAAGRPQQRALHRQQRGLQDIEQVDFLVVGLGHRPRRSRARGCASASTSRRSGVSCFESRRPRIGALRIKNHRRRHHRPGQRPASGLIHACDQFGQCRKPSASSALVAQQSQHRLSGAAPLRPPAATDAPAETRAADTRDRARHRARARARRHRLPAVTASCRNSGTSARPASRFGSEKYGNRTSRSVRSSSAVTAPNR